MGPVDWTLQITRDVFAINDEARNQRKKYRNGERKKWTQNVRRKQYFVCVTIFRVRAHNVNVMNFLISILTIYLSIFFMSMLFQSGFLVSTQMHEFTENTILFGMLLPLSSSIVTIVYLHFFFQSLRWKLDVFQLSNLRINSFLVWKKKKQMLQNYWKIDFFFLSLPGKFLSCRMRTGCKHFFRGCKHL